jgi:hypothetical protein
MIAASRGRSPRSSACGSVCRNQVLTAIANICGAQVTYYTVFVIELDSRRVHIVGSTPHPDEAFMLQIARQLTDASDGVLDGQRFLICDRDRKWSTAVRHLLETSSVRVSGHRFGRRTAMRTRSGLFAQSKRNA